MKISCGIIISTTYFHFAINAFASVLFVDLNSTSPTPPYATWSTAATNIQDAIDAAASGDQIKVTNGIYQTGGRTVNGFALTNRIVVNQAVTLQSVNGANATAILGCQIPGIANGDSAVRVVYLTNGAALIGFTISNGATLTNGDQIHEDSGGGIWCESTNVFVSNCIITGNTVMWHGGGAVYGTFSNCMFSANAAGSFDGYGGGTYKSTLNNCSLAGNTANYGGGANGGILNFCLLTNNNARTAGGGVDSLGATGTTLNNCTLVANMAGQGGGGVGSGCTLNNCILTNNSVYTNGNGGGAYGCTLNNCVLVNNFAPGIFAYGGGAYQSTLNNCALVGNWAAQYGGASYYGTLNNCLLYSNSVVSGFGGGSYYGTLNNCTIIGNSANTGGGTYFSTMNNCIIYFNTAAQSPNNRNNGNLLNYCCTTPMPSGGTGNFTNDPVFVNYPGGDFHLQSNSPCINSGNNGYAGSTNDLDGNSRIVGGAVDLGAFENQAPGNTLPYLWAQQYGLSTDGSIDTDGDGMNNWQEWIAGTSPTNANSLLRMLSIINNISGAKVIWQSVNGKIYFLQRSANLSAQPVFFTIGTYIFGKTGTTTYNDIGAVGPGPYFYRVGVQ
jgi:hypothetical protein